MNEDDLIKLISARICRKRHRLQAVPKRKELMKEGLQTTQEEMKYTLPTQRKIHIGRNRRVRQSNLIRNSTNPFPLETA